MKVNQYIAFQQKFNVDELKASFLFRISADNKYVAWINGQLLEFGQYADYPFYKVYDEIPVPGDLLKVGENILSVLGYCQNEDSSIYRIGEASLIYELVAGDEILAASSKQTICSELTGYTSGVVEKISLQASYSFQYDATLCDGWIFTDNSNKETWQTVKVLNKYKSYYPRPITYLQTDETISAQIVAQGKFIKPLNETTSGNRIYKSFMQHLPISQLTDKSENLPSTEGIFFNGASADGTSEGDGVYIIIDLIKEQAGYASLDIEFEDECLVDIGYGEHLVDLRVRSTISGRNFAFSYKSSKGRNQFTHYIKRIAGRYLQLHVYGHKFRLHYAGMLTANYPLTEKKYPSGLNKLEERIYKVSLDTLKLCMHEHYEDSPWREQALYAMDSYNQMLSGYYAFEEYDFAKSSIRLLGYGMRDDGLLEMCAPSRISDTIPSFSLIWIASVWKYCEHSKDFNFGKEMIPVIERLLETFASYIKDGLVQNQNGYWHFYEWTSYMEGLNQNRDAYSIRACADAPLNAFYAMALESAIKLYDSLEMEQKSNILKAKIESLKIAYNRAFLSQKHKAYRVSTMDSESDIFTEGTQALTICANLCNDNEDRAILQEKIANGDFPIKMTLSHRIFKYEALLLDPSYTTFVYNEISDLWGKMLFEGATSFWETDAGAPDFADAGSLCHGWSATPAYIYNKYKKTGGR